MHSVSFFEFKNLYTRHSAFYLQGSNIIICFLFIFLLRWFQKRALVDKFRNKSFVSSATCWLLPHNCTVVALGTTTSLFIYFFCIYFVSYSDGCYTDSSDNEQTCMQHPFFLSFGAAVKKCSLLHSLTQTQAWNQSMFIQPHSVFASLECVCESPVNIVGCCELLSLCIWSLAVSWVDWIHHCTPLLTSSLFNSLCFCHSFPCAMEQTLSLEWLGITLLTLCPFPFMFSKKNKKVWVIY